MTVPETFILADIRLRRPQPADADSIFEYGSDPEVARYADWVRQTRVEPIVELLRAREEFWNTGTEYYWIITPKMSDLAIGGISCRVGKSSAEVGYLLNKKYWGNGYATAAARAIVEWALSLSYIYRVWATCDTENIASIRVLEKIGMQKEGLLKKYSIRPNISDIPRDAYMYARTR